MQDRVPLYPGRVKMIPVAGQANTFDMVRADEPTAEGTPLNKSTLLQDATCLILDIPNTSVPNDAFLKLAMGIGQYGYAITVLYPDGSPIEGATLTGIKAPDGGVASTDANGLAVGVSSEQSVTIGVSSPYIDLQNVSGINIQSAGILTQYSLALQYDESVKTFLSSQIYKISPKATFGNFCTVGGGGGGAGSQQYTINSGGGGGGGYTNNLVNFDLSAYQTRNVSILIGSGGSGGGTSTLSGGTGGTTTISIDGSSILSSSGGSGAPGGSSASGGAGNGNGGTGQRSGIIGSDGGSSSIRIFNKSENAIAGGGGGGGGIYSGSRFTGGSPNGGDGGDYENPRTGENGVAPGGGGGGAGSSSAQGSNSSGGSGGDGAAYIQILHIVRRLRNELLYSIR